MSSAARKVTIEYLGEDVSASRVAKQVGESTHHTSEVFHKLGTAAKIGFGVATLAVAKFVKDSTTGYRDHLKVAHLTEQVLKSTGSSAWITAKQVGALGDTLERKTGIDGDAIQSGENLLLTFKDVRNEAGQGNQIFDRTTRLMNDMSVAMGQSVKSSAIQMGKALNDPVKGMSALSRVGVTFSATQAEAIKKMQESGNTLGAQKVILKELASEFGGAAKAAATPAEKAAAAYHQLQDQVGAVTVPIMNQLYGVFTHKIAPALMDLANKYLPKVQKFFAGGMSGTKTSHALSDMWGNLKKLGPVFMDLLHSLPSFNDVLDVSSTVLKFAADHTDLLRKALPYLVAGIVAYKGAQLLANAAQLIGIPMKVTEIVVNRQLVNSNRELIASRVGLTATTAEGTAVETLSIAGKIRQAVVTTAASVASKAYAAAQWAVNAAMEANPIGLVVVALAALVGGAILAYNKISWFRDGVNAVFGWLKDGLSTLGGFFSDLWDGITNGLGDLRRFYVNVWKGILDFFLDVALKILQGADKMFGWVPGVGDKLDNAVDAFKTFKGKVDAVMDAAAGDAKDKGTKTGTNYAQGFMAGLNSMFGEINGWVNNTVALLDRVLRKKGEIQSPSKFMARIGDLFGQGFIKGLVGGIEGGKDQIQSVLDEVAQGVKDAADKLHADMQKKRSIVSGFTSSFGQSVFGSDATDVQSIVQLAQQQAMQARNLTHDTKRLERLGLSKAAIRQMLAAGDSGRAQIEALASGASAQQIRALNQAIAQQARQLHHGGNILGNDLEGDQIAQDRRDLKTAKAFADALEAKLKPMLKDLKDNQVIEVHIDGRHIEASLHHTKRRNGNRPLAFETA